MTERHINWRVIMAAGGPKKVATATGYHENTVLSWTRGKAVAANAVIKICRMAGGAFQPYDLRPDVFDERHSVEVTA